MVTYMRIGCTSYTYPADILTNVRRLAGRVKDIEIVIFQADDPENDLPDESTVAELRELALYHDLTYTVHLPLNLKLGLHEASSSMDTAVRVIRCTKALHPYGYVVHLEGQSSIDPYESGKIMRVFGEDYILKNELVSGSFKRWRENSIRSLAVLIDELEDPASVCVENLDNQTGDMIGAILDEMPISCCADIGHFWKQGTDPLFWLEAWSDRLRVVHLHGVGERDHMSLSLAPEGSLDSVVDFLAHRFDGVLTLEVFNECDWIGSLKALEASAARLGLDLD